MESLSGMAMVRLHNLAHFGHLWLGLATSALLWTMGLGAARADYPDDLKRFLETGVCIDCNLRQVDFRYLDLPRAIRYPAGSRSDRCQLFSGPVNGG